MLFTRLRVFAVRSIPWSSTRPPSSAPHQRPAALLACLTSPAMPGACCRRLTPGRQMPRTGAGACANPPRPPPDGEPARCPGTVLLARHGPGGGGKPGWDLPAERLRASPRQDEKRHPGEWSDPHLAQALRASGLPRHTDRQLGALSGTWTRRKSEMTAARFCLRTSSSYAPVDRLCTTSARSPGVRKRSGSPT